MNNMKSGLIGLALLVASIAMAAEIPAAKKSSSQVSFAFETFGVVETPDLDQSKAGVGLGATAQFNNYFGFSVEAYSFDTANLFVDRIGASLRYNILTRTKSRPYIFAGGWHDFEQDANGIHIGVGVAHQFAKYFTPFAEIRMNKPIEGPSTAPTAMLRGGLSLGF